jgi:hypothetical protein
VRAWPGLRASTPPRPCNCHGQSWKSLMRVSYLGHPCTSEVSSGCPDGGQTHFGASVRGNCLQRRTLGTKLGPSGAATTLGYPVCCFFFAFGAYVMYISIFLHMLMYKDIGEVVFLHPCVHGPPAIAGWAS